MIMTLTRPPRTGARRFTNACREWGARAAHAERRCCPRPGCSTGSSCGRSLSRPARTTVSVTRRLFGARQAGMIEAAFEGCTDVSDETYDLPIVLADQCLRFADRYPDPVARLRAIMRNIVANKGTFNPERK